MSAEPGGRYYLNGADWLAQALHRIDRRHGGAGSGALAVRELDGRLDAERLRKDAAAFAESEPFLCGRPFRAWNLAPYWRVPRRGRAEALPLRVHELEETQAQWPPHAFLAELSNTAPAGRYPYLELHLLRSPGQNDVLALWFDHRLLDGHGSELFLNRLCTFSAGSAQSPAVHRDQASGLSRWPDRFASGRTVMRTTRALEEQDLAPRRAPSDGARLNYAVLELDVARSTRFLKAAEDRAGYLMLAPFVLYHACRQLVRRIQGVEGDTRMLASASINMRPPADSAAHLYLNHYSLLRFAVPPAMEIDAAMKDLKGQFYQQMKLKVHAAFEDAWLLMRILPLGLFGRLIGHFADSVPESLNLAVVAQPHVGEVRMQDLRVLNAYHMPRCPPLVGGGLYIVQWGERVNLCLSYYESLFGAEGAGDYLEAVYAACVDADA